jgi:WD40 repeat protein
MTGYYVFGHRLELRKLTILIAALLFTFGMVGGLAQASDVGPADQVLSPENPTATDRYGEALPVGALARLGTTRFRPGHNVLSMAYAPDGRLLATAGGPILHLWDARTGRLVRQFEANPKGAVYAVRFSPNGKLLATAIWENQAVVWDAATCRELARMQGHEQDVQCLAFAPDGKRLVTGSWDGTVRLWDVATGHQIRSLKVGHAVWAAAYAPDGRTVVSGSDDGVVRIWDANDGRELQRLDANNGWVDALAYAPDGRTLAAGTLRNLPHEGGEVHIWDLATCRETRQWKLPCGVGSVAYSKDGRTLAVAERSQGADAFVAEAFILDVATRKKLRTLPVRGGWGVLAYSPDGRTLAVGSQDSVQLWNPNTGQDVTGVNGHRAGVIGLAFASDDKTLFSASSDGTVRHWDLQSSSEVRQFIGNTYAGHALACPPDSRTVAAAGVDGIVRIWDIGSGKELHQLRGHEGSVNAIGCSADGSMLISGGEDATIRQWDVPTGRQLRRLNATSTVHWIVLAPNGKTIAASHPDDRTLRLWDIATGTEKARLKGWPNFVFDACYSPDGKLLAWCDSSVLHVWDTRTGKDLRQIRVPKILFSAVSFSPDGRMLITGDHELAGWVRLWEVASGKEAARFLGHGGPIDAVVFSREGQKAASAGCDTSILIWDVTGQSSVRNPQLLDDGRLQQLWADLASPDASKAHRALWTLVGAPDRAVALLRKYVKPASPPDPERVAACLRGLDADQFADREKATGELISMGDPVARSVRQALAGELTPEGRRRVERVLRDLEPDQCLDVLRQVRAVQTLEAISTPEARQLLRDLARGLPGARLTEEAKSSLDRLQAARKRR